MRKATANPKLAWPWARGGAAGFYGRGEYAQHLAAWIAPLGLTFAFAGLLALVMSFTNGCMTWQDLQACTDLVPSITVAVVLQVAASGKRNTPTRSSRW